MQQVFLWSQLKPVLLTTRQIPRVIGHNSFFISDSARGADTELAKEESSKLNKEPVRRVKKSAVPS
jgi:hypothetical protein